MKTCNQCGSALVEITGYSGNKVGFAADVVPVIINATLE